MDVVAVERERGARVDGRGGKDGLVQLGFGPLDDVAPVDAEDVVQLRVAAGGSPSQRSSSRTRCVCHTHIFFGPDARFGHGEDEVGAGEEHDAGAFPLDLRRSFAVRRGPDALDASADGVDLVVKVVEDLGRREVARLAGLPRIDGEPVARVVDGAATHLYAVSGGGEAELGVAVVDGGEVAADDVELRVEVGVVASHLEQAQVEEGDGRVAPARDEHQRRLVHIRACGIFRVSDLVREIAERRGSRGSDGVRSAA